MSAPADPTPTDVTPHLLAFAARYEADPAGVAATIAALAILCVVDDALARNVRDFIVAYGWPEQHVETVGCTLTMAAAAALCSVYGGDGYVLFHIAARDRAAIALLGAHGWLGERLATVRPQPVTDGGAP